MHGGARLPTNGNLPLGPSVQLDHRVSSMRGATPSQRRRRIYHLSSLRPQQCSRPRIESAPRSPLKDRYATILLSFHTGFDRLAIKDRPHR